MAPKRRPDPTSLYHSPLRAKQAAETRRAIIDAAGTAVDTIYTTFGSKSALMMAAIEVAIVGDDEEAAMIDRADFALLGKGRRTDRLRAGVRYTVGVYQRSVPILKALQEAAASDEAARNRLAQYDEDRRNVTAAGLALILGGAVPEKVVDAIWALTSPEVFVYLTEGRGWSVDDAEAWLVHMSTAAISHPDTDTDSPQ